MFLTSFNQTKPLMGIKESKKDAAWYGSVAQYFINRSYTFGNFQDRVNLQNLADAYYNNVQSLSNYKGLTEYNGAALQAIWANINTVRPRINAICQQFVNQQYQMKVACVNKDAKTREEEARIETFAAIATRDDMMSLEQMSGLPTMSPLQRELPEKIEDAEEFFKETYKDKAAICIDLMLKWYLGQFPEKLFKRQIIENTIIFGMAVVLIEYVNGIPLPRVIDPRNVAYDTLVSDTFGGESTYFCIVEYMAKSVAIEKYKISDPDEIAFINQASAFSTINPSAFSVNNGTSNILFFNQVGNEQHVLVCTTYFRDTKKADYFETEDDKGNVHLNKSKKTNSKKIPAYYDVWRKATIIGGQVLAEYGECTNLVRSVDKTQKCQAPIKIFTADIYKGQPQLIFTSLIQIIDKINFTVFKIEQEVAKSIGKVIRIFPDEAPDNFTPETLMQYLKAHGVLFQQGTRDGIPTAASQANMSEADFGISQSVSQFIQLYAMYEQMIDTILGTNRSFTGQAASTAPTSSINANIQQANLQIGKYYDGALTLLENVYTHIVQMTRLQGANKDYWYNIIGKNNYEWLLSDIPMDLQDFGVFIQAKPLTMANEQNLKEFVTVALQQGMIEMDEALTLLSEPDAEMAVKKTIKIIGIRKKEQKAMKQQEMQMQAQMQQQALQADRAKQQFQSERQLANADKSLQNKKELLADKAQAEWAMEKGKMALQQQ